MHGAHSGRRGFTFIDLVVVLAVVALLIALVPMTSQLASQRSKRIQCAANLKQIGMGMLVYGNDNRAFPRTAYDTTRPAATGFDGSGASAGGFDQVPVNNVSAAMFLLVREIKIAPFSFVCPGTGHKADAAAVANRQSRWNFSGADNLDYSLANPYPTVAAVGAGYKYAMIIPASFALAADRNTGMDDTTATVDSSSEALRGHNSTNHDRQGQNVLYVDGHVEWQSTPWCGANRDHIYARAVKRAGSYEMASPPRIDANGFPDPACELDSVMLPVFAPQTAGGFVAGAKIILVGSSVVGLAVLAGVVILVVVLTRRAQKAVPAGGPSMAVPPGQRR